MKFEEKAQIEIIKTAMNPHKRSSLLGAFDTKRGKLVYTDNGLQIFTLDNDAIYIDIDKCFPKGYNAMAELLFEKEPYGDLAVTTLQLRQTKDSRIVEEFQTVEGKPRSIWVDRKLLNRFEQPSAYIMGKYMLYLEDKQGFRYGAILGVKM